MASVRNSYSLLMGGGESPAPAASKPKKKKGKKGGQSGNPDGAQEAAAAPATTIVPAKQPDQPQLQTAKDACAALEAAAVAAGAGERAALAMDWTDQVLRGDALFADGSDLADFKQVLLKSRALELLLEGCLSRGATAGEAPAIAQLLAAVAHPSVPLAFTQALADTAASLGQVAAADPLAPTVPATRSAAAALKLTLRGLPKPPPAKPTEAPITKLKRLGGELGRHETRLPATTQPKELCKVYGSILELLCGQLDVLRPAGAAGGAPLPSELAAALAPLEELRSALAARLQEVQAPPKPALSLEEQLAQAEAAHKKADAATTSRLTEVEARIVSLESELAALKGEAGELRRRRTAAAESHKQRLQQIRSGRADTGASRADIVAAVQGGLGAVDGLSAAVRGGAAVADKPSAAAASGANSVSALGEAVVAAEVPVKLLGAMQQVVELNLQQLVDLGGKAHFYRERVAKAVKQGEQAAKLGVGDPKLFQQQRAGAEKNLKEVLASAEAAAAACRGAVSSYRERLPLMLRLPSFLPPPPEYLPAMEARAQEAEQVLAAINAGTYVPPAAAPAPAAATAPAAKPRGGAAAAPAAAGGASAPLPADLMALEQRLALLEEENVKKDAQIAAMISSSTLEVPSPLAGRTSMPPAMLSSPTNNKPVGPAAPIAPAPAAAAAAAPTAPAAAAPAPIGAAAAAGAPVISFSQALASAPPQANGKKGRPRRA